MSSYMLMALIFEIEYPGSWLSPGAVFNIPVQEFRGEKKQINTQNCI